MTEEREHQLLAQVRLLEADNAQLRAEVAALREAQAGSASQGPSRAGDASQPQSILYPGLHCVSLEEVMARHGPPPWAERVILTDEMQATIICQREGDPNDLHYHNRDEWWVVMKGEIHWEIEDAPDLVRAKAGDFVYCPRRHFHHIHPQGDGPTIRVGIGVVGEYHRHEK